MILPVLHQLKGQVQVNSPSVLVNLTETPEVQESPRGHAENKLSHKHSKASKLWGHIDCYIQYFS